MRFLTSSLFRRTLWTLVPFVASISILYSLLLVNAIQTTEDYVVTQYLQKEYERFQSERPVSPPWTLPGTSYLRSYWEDDVTLPTSYRSLPEGRHESPDNKFQILVATPQGSEQRLFMVLDENRFSALEQFTPPLLFAVYLIAAVVIVIGAVLAAFIARSLTRPVTALASEASQADDAADVVFTGLARADEIGTLSRAFTSLVMRLRGALQRESYFTRHASHEMRTPLAVISNSAAVLAIPGVDEAKRVSSLGRIQQACDDLRMLLDVFLCLGQESSSLPVETVEIEPLVSSLLDKHRQVMASKNMRATMDLMQLPSLEVSPPLLTIVLDNLIRNAVFHGAQELAIRADRQSLEITNALPEPLSPTQHGYGLEICRRVCQRLQWKFQSKREGDRYRSILVFLDR